MNLYQIHSEDPSFNAKEGTLLAIGTYLHSLGFKPKEIKTAILAMIHNDTDTAVFDENLYFVSSYNRQRKVS